MVGNQPDQPFKILNRSGRVIWYCFTPIKAPRTEALTGLSIKGTLLFPDQAVSALPPSALMSCDRLRLASAIWTLGTQVWQADLLNEWSKWASQEPIAQHMAWVAVLDPFSKRKMVSRGDTDTGFDQDWPFPPIFVYLFWCHILKYACFACTSSPACSSSPSAMQ